ncbi:MAG TPA: hypothetical protein VIU65_06440 [Pyrinomonadaceae bacterium]
MTNDERLDRIERLAKLFARAGVRERRARRELRENINMVINLQIENEDRWARNEDRWARNEDRWARTDERIREMALSVRELAVAQTQTDQRLDRLIDTIQKDRNGTSA